MPEPNVGSRQVSPPPVDPGAEAEYNAFVWSILAMPFKGTITFSLEADRLREAFQQTVENRLGAEWEWMQDWGGKLTSAMLRACLKSFTYK